MTTSVRFSPLNCLLMTFPLALGLLVGTPGYANDQLSISEQTPVGLILDCELKSGSAKVGDSVAFKTIAPIYSSDHIQLVPAGASAVGTVTRSSHHGAFGKAGKLDFTCDYVIAPDGTHIMLRGQKLSGAGRDNTGAMVASTIFLGPLMLLINGRDIVMHRGLPLEMWVNQITTIAAPTMDPDHRLHDWSFQMRDQSAPRVVGNATSFDGDKYSVSTSSGSQAINFSDLKSITDADAAADR